MPKRPPFVELIAVDWPLALDWPLAVDWPEFFLDLVLPATDRVVGIQWAVMGPIWLFAVGYSWQCERDIRHFIQGLCLFSFAWFLARMIH